MAGIEYRQDINGNFLGRFEDGTLEDYRAQLTFDNNQKCSELILELCPDYMQRNAALGLGGVDPNYVSSVITWFRDQNHAKQVLIDAATTFDDLAAVDMVFTAYP